MTSLVKGSLLLGLREELAGRKLASPRTFRAAPCSAVTAAPAVQFCKCIHKRARMTHIQFTCLKLTDITSGIYSLYQL